MRTTQNYILHVFHAMKIILFTNVRLLIIFLIKLCFFFEKHIQSLKKGKISEGKKNQTIHTGALYEISKKIKKQH